MERKFSPVELGFIEYMSTPPEPEPFEAFGEVVQGDADMGPNTYVFRGWLSEEPDPYARGEPDDDYDDYIIMLRESDEIAKPLVDIVYDRLDRVHYDESWSVHYFVATKELSHDQLVEAFFQRILGGTGQVSYWEGFEDYSEWTPGSSTYQEFKVGGHDLLEELRTHVGKFLHLEIVIGGEKQ